MQKRKASSVAEVSKTDIMLQKRNTNHQLPLPALRTSCSKQLAVNLVLKENTDSCRFLSHSLSGTLYTFCESCSALPIHTCFPSDSTLTMYELKSKTYFRYFDRNLVCLLSSISRRVKFRGIFMKHHLRGADKASFSPR